MNNSFYKINDICCDKFLINLEPNFFWSRRYEYPHMFSEIQKQNPKKILDAASGSYHPFKFMLSNNGYDVFSCDLELFDYVSTMHLMKNYAYDLSKKEYDDVHFSIQNIMNMNYDSNMFDAIVCISVLEHLDSEISIEKSLCEFARCLNTNGKIYLTVDYPNVSPEKLIVIANKVGLKIVGDFDYSMNEDCITSSYFGSQLWCFNMILEKV